MSDPKIEAIQRLYDAYARGDVDAVLAEVTDDVDWAAEAASTSVPWYGTYRGKDDVPRFFKEIGSNVEVTEFTPLSFASNDTDVIVAVRWAYTVNATGRHAAMLMQHWWRFADGRIVWFRGSEDSAQTVAAFAPSNVDTVRAGYAAFARGDIPAVLAMFVEEAQWYAPDELPTGGTFRGPAGIAAFFSGLPAHYDVLQVQPMRFLDAGEQVVVEGHHAGQIAGTSFDVGFVHVWTLGGGRVVEFREYMDSGKLLPLFATV